MNYLLRMKSLYNQKLFNSHRFRKIMQNTGWLFIEKVARMAISLVVGVWMAKYLGPKSFGLFNYSLAYIGIFITLSKLGLDNIIIRNIVKDPKNTEIYLGTGFCLKLFGGICCSILSMIIIRLLEPTDHILYISIIILSFTVILQSVEVIDFWYQSKVKSKYMVLVRSGAFIISSICKVLFIVIKYPLIYFVIVNLLECIILTLLLIWVYKHNGYNFKKWKFSVGTAKNLLKDSWPLIISGIAVLVYMRMDQIMIGNILGSEEVGIFSVAIRLVELWYFIPVIIVSSTFPYITRQKSENEFLYYRNIQIIYNLLTWIAIPTAIVVTIFSQNIITFLYGIEYRQAATILSISIWACVFAFQGTARGIWIQNENLQRYTYWYTIAGAFTNFFLNYFLLNRIGVIGAAYSTLISQFIVAIVAPAFFKQTRLSSIMLVKAFLFGKIKEVDIERYKSKVGNHGK